MSELAACASCTKSQDAKQCARCKTVLYCSTACQRAHWQVHKPSCHFKVVLPPAVPANPSTDALSLLHTMSDPGTKQKEENVSPVTQRTFNVPELRLSILSLLPARDLLRSRSACRSWYLTITSGKQLQQRMFFTPGPGELIMAAHNGDEVHPALHPYNSRRREAHAMEKDLEARHGGSGVYLLTTAKGPEELSSAAVQQTGLSIIMNPFLTHLWPQNPENMTLIPAMFASERPQTDSWRRMQLTSPPVTSLSMSLWFTKRNAQGNQLLPSTGHVPTGVTLGHFADMLAAQPKKLEYHWMQLHGAASWARSVDAVVLPNDGVDVEHSDGYRGVYVNPSNGIAFPGGFGMG